MASDKALRIWDLNAGKCQHILEGDGFVFNSVDILPDGKKCVCECSDDSLRIFDIKTGRFLHNVPCHKYYRTAVASDRKSFVFEPFHGILWICDMESGKCQNILEGHEKVAILAILITPDGKHCISACADKTLRIWDMESGKCLHVLEGDTSAVCAAAITPDGKRCVSGSLDHTLRIWDTDTGECLKILEGHQNGVNLVAIAPDGKRCVSGSSDGALHFWNMKSGECFRTVKGNGSEVNSLKISLSGKHLICAFSDGIIRIWDMNSGKCLKTFRQMLGLNLFGADLSAADITPSEYVETLDQNGLIVSLKPGKNVLKKAAERLGRFIRLYLKKFIVC